MGWSPTISLRQGLKEVIDEYSKNKVAIITGITGQDGSY